MGAVYLAIDESLRRNVALKVMLPKYAADAAASERFRREARAAAAVKHDNVVTVYQVGEDFGIPFIAMEFLSGYPLDEYLKRKGRLTVAQALRVGAETAAGLAAAHSHGLIHRDIKPGNLWLEAPQGRIKILDFGLAKPVEEGEPGGELTGTGIVLGTPAFMAPEQARGAAVDHRADLFSLGVVLFQLTTGQRPFDRATQLASMIALATDAAPSVRELNPDVPEALDRLIQMLLAKDPSQRPQTASEVAKMLRALERGEQLPEQRDLTVLPTTAQPQVVYVPIHVTAYEAEASEFANLADSSVGSTSPAARERTEKKPAHSRPKPRFPVGIVVSAVFFAVCVAVATYLILRNPKEVAKQPSPSGEQKPDERPKPPAVLPKPADPERQVAEWVLANQGTVTLQNGVEIRAVVSLPQGTFAIEAITFADPPYKLSDADIERLRVCTVLKKLSCRETSLTDAGFITLTGLPCAPQLTTVVLPSPNATANGVATLVKCRSLKLLNVSQVRLSGHLDFVKQLPYLNYLFVAGCELVDDDLKALANIRLSGLSINDNPKITSAGLEHLRERAALASLDVTRTNIRRKSASVIATFPKLAYLRAEAMDWTDDDISAFRSLTELQTLSLLDSPITDKSLEMLQGMQMLNTLVLNRTKITDVGLPKIAVAKQLKELHLRGTNTTTPNVKKLMEALPNCAVTFDYNPVTDRDRHLAEWLIGKGGSVRLSRPANNRTYLTVQELPSGPLFVYFVSLPLMGHSLTDSDVERFRDTSVIWYALAGPHLVSDDGFERWSQFPNTDKVLCLELINTTVTVKGYSNLAKFQSLEALHLTKSNVTDEVLVACRGLNNLTNVGLQQTKITDAGLKHLEGLSKLKSLDLLQTDTGDVGADSLAKLLAVESLLLRGTKLSDTGLAKLVACKTLTTLDVSNTRVTADGVKRFQTALPKCKVISNFAR
jgi:serine/threonine protein kinase/Leucine-rich repeat (LRR) protein